MKYVSRLTSKYGSGALQKMATSPQLDEIFLPAAFNVPSIWTADDLSRLISTRMADNQIIVVSNRQPFTHEFAGEQVKMVQPASGLVTALEPIVRACDGTWIAHGSGPCDRDFVDSHDRCPAPVGTGSYTLRRLWLSEQEQRGYCDGFANSGL